MYEGDDYHSFRLLECSLNMHVLESVLRSFVVYWGHQTKTILRDKRAAFYFIFYLSLSLSLLCVILCLFVIYIPRIRWSWLDNPRGFYIQDLPTQNLHIYLLFLLLPPVWNKLLLFEYFFLVSAYGQSKKWHTHHLEGSKHPLYLILT